MQTVLLIVALSMDVFLASVACGAEQIRIEKKTALCIGTVCSGVLFFFISVRKTDRWSGQGKICGVSVFCGIVSGRRL